MQESWYYSLMGAVSIVLVQQSSLQNLNLSDNRFVSLVEEDVAIWKTSVPPERIPEIGFRNIIADYTFVQFLSYFGDDSRLTTGYAASPIFFETIIQKDPFFRDFYLFLSQSVSVQAGDPDRAISLMNEGISHLAPNQPPDGFHILRYKGIDELLFAGDSKAAQSTFERAAGLGRAIQPTR